MPARYIVGYERLQAYRVEGFQRWIPRERFVIWNYTADTQQSARLARFYVDFYVDADTGLARAPSITVDHADPWDLRAYATLSLIERIARDLRWDTTPSDLQGILARMRAVKHCWEPSPGPLAPVDVAQYRPV